MAEKKRKGGALLTQTDTRTEDVQTICPTKEAAPHVKGHTGLYRVLSLFYLSIQIPASGI